MTISSGNTNSKSLNLTADGARLTAIDKVSLYLQIMASRAESTTNGITSTNTTANQRLAGMRYDRTITGELFGFGGLDFSHDQIKRLSLRSIVSAGLGYHVVKTAGNQWDIFGGLAYRKDKYKEPGVLINNELKTSLNATELQIGEESSHKLTESTSFKKTGFQPQPEQQQGSTCHVRCRSLLVALDKTMSLSITLQDRYDSLTQAPASKNDILFFTGINVEFGG